MSEHDFSTEQTGRKAPRRRLVAAAVVGGLALVGGGWALTHSSAVTGSQQPAATAKQLDLRADGATAPADQPTSAPTAASVDPMEAQFQAVVQTSLTELGTKIGKRPDEIATAMETVGPRIKPSQAEMASYKTGDAKTRALLRTSVGNRWLSAMATELGVDRATLATAVNQVKDEQFAANEPLVKAALDRAVASGDLTRTDANNLLVALRDEKIGG